MLKLFVLVCLSVNAFVDSLPLEDTVIEEYIVGGKDTDISKVPYQVAVYSGEWFRCGGFIISPTHVVTSGLCVLRQRDAGISIRAGSSSHDKEGVVVRAKNIYRNPKFNEVGFDYDVSVIELVSPLNFTNKIKPIKLATKEPAVGTEVLVSGWGFVSEDMKPPKTLQSVTVPIYDRTKCANNFKGRNITITPRMICAGAEGKTAYYLDNGGPLVYKDEVVGIVSFAIGCGKKDLPAVYCNVALPEINKFIKDNAKL